MFHDLHFIHFTIITRNRAAGKGAARNLALQREILQDD